MPSAGIFIFYFYMVLLQKMMAAGIPATSETGIFFKENEKPDILKYYHITNITTIQEYSVLL
mgnify:CR=1 FL=1